MSEHMATLASALQKRFSEVEAHHEVATDEVTLEVSVAQYREIAVALRDEPSFAFAQLSDLCGVDYLAYGDAEWMTEDSTELGYSRGVERYSGEEDPERDSPRRFAVVCHLLSIEHNWRLRLRVYAADAQFPMVPSVVDIWPAANWFEREAFDLFGIHFEGHPDLRRILTDYGFIGHPFRKDFPLSGHVEVRFDPDRGRVVYQPVTIEPRVTVPKVIRAARHQRPSEPQEAGRDG